ncbi:ATP-binding protein [Streptomyces monomycini]|uniref:ATP-binding protein n=1 Tax=Streptomyces monomycini TaxID=371720 RepID=UPI00067C9B41|nr:ATP-binding protein [Streptomyces monomycini]
MTQDPSAPRPLYVLNHELAMGLGVPQFTARRFTAHPDSLRALPPFIRRTLRAWDVPVCMHDALTVVSELAANAARHALGDAHAWLGLAGTEHFILCTVTDPSTRLPEPVQSQTDSSDCRRGLRVVHRLSEEWGCTLLSDGTGKTVWARLRI